MSKDPSVMRYEAMAAATAGSAELTVVETGFATLPGSVVAAVAAVGTTVVAVGVEVVAVGAAVVTVVAVAVAVVTVGAAAVTVVVA